MPVVGFVGGEIDFAEESVFFFLPGRGVWLVVFGGRGRGEEGRVEVTFARGA